MKTTREYAAILALGLVAIAAIAGTQSLTQRDASTLARFERHAGPPLDRVHYFNTDGFQYLGKDAQGRGAVAVRADVSHVYLVKVLPPCIRLDTSNAIGLTSNANEISPRFDFVVAGHQRCKIASIQSVDEKAMRHEDSNPPAVQSGSGGM